MGFFRNFIKKGQAILLPMLLFITLLCSQSSAATKAPQFALPAATDGSVIDLKDYSGKVVVVNFFTTWCPPCREEIPSLNSIHEEYESKGVSILGISLDDGSSKVVVKFMKKMKILYPVAMADDNVTRDFGGVIGIPTTFLVDQKGDVAKRYDGFVPHDILLKDIKELIKSK